MRQIFQTLIAVLLVASACGSGSDSSTLTQPDNSSPDTTLPSDSDSDPDPDSSSDGGSEIAVEEPILVLRHDDPSVQELPLSVVQGATQHEELLALVRTLSEEADLSVIEELDVETSFLIVGGYYCGDGGRVLEFTIDQVISPLREALDCEEPDPHLSIFQLEKAEMSLPFDLVDAEYPEDRVVETVESWEASDEPVDSEPEPAALPFGELVGEEFSYLQDAAFIVPGDRGGELQVDLECEPLTLSLELLLAGASEISIYEDEDWTVDVGLSTLGPDDAASVVELMREAGAECPTWSDYSTSEAAAVGQDEVVFASYLKGDQLFYIELRGGSDGLGAERIDDLLATLTR